MKKPILNKESYIVEIEHMDSVELYLKQLIPERSKWMASLEQYAKKHHIPIMEPVSMNFLTQLVRMKEPESILEIGSAIGYSALRMYEAHPMTKITTIEKDENMYQIAKQNIENTKIHNIEVLLGDALKVIEQLALQNKTYDFIFIDAAKGQYKRFFEFVQPLMKTSGIIVCDNILFKGYVANENKANNIRLQKLAKKIRNFNTWLMEQEMYHTTLIPIGDGLSISVKK